MADNTALSKQQMDEEQIALADSTALSKQQMDEEQFALAVMQAVLQSERQVEWQDDPKCVLVEGKSSTSQWPREQPTVLLALCKLPARVLCGCRHVHRILGAGAAGFRLLDTLRPYAREDGIAVPASSLEGLC